jgi:hypothetical protein
MRRPIAKLLGCLNDIVHPILLAIRHLDWLHGPMQTGDMFTTSAPTSGSGPHLSSPVLIPAAGPGYVGAMQGARRSTMPRKADVG